jgi:hypothetical protein
MKKHSKALAKNGQNFQNSNFANFRARHSSTGCPKHSFAVLRHVKSVRRESPHPSPRFCDEPRMSIQSLNILSALGAAMRHVNTNLVMQKSAGWWDKSHIHAWKKLYLKNCRQLQRAATIEKNETFTLLFSSESTYQIRCHKNSSSSSWLALRNPSMKYSHPMGDTHEPDGRGRKWNITVKRWMDKGCTKSKNKLLTRIHH